MSKTPNLQSISWGDFTLDLNFYLGHDYVDISEASTELPAVIEWVNEKLQQVTEDRMRKKSEIKRLEARVFFDLRNGGFEDRQYAGKPTEAALDKAISLDPDVQVAEDEFSVLTGWHGRLANLLTSLQSKLDMTRSVESTRRKLVEEQ